MRKLDISQDLIKAEQGIWFAQSDLNNAIQKLHNVQASKRDIMQIKQLHEQVLKLANKIERTVLNIQCKIK